MFTGRTFLRAACFISLQFYEWGKLILFKYCEKSRFPYKMLSSAKIC